MVTYEQLLRTPKAFPALTGLYLEEFDVGRKFEHALRRTVTEMDNTLFTCLTHNPQPLHIDHEFARQSEWGKPLVNSIFTLGLMIGVSVNDTTLGTTVGNLGMTDVRFPKPVFHGDTLNFTTEVLGRYVVWLDRLRSPTGASLSRRTKSVRFSCSCQ